jgi:hypothetical protein
VRLWLALVTALLWSAFASAQMQCVERRNPQTGQVVTLCGGDMTRPRECDAQGCYFDELKTWQARHNADNLRRELQQRAEEARKKREADRKKSD